MKAKGGTECARSGANCVGRTSWSARCTKERLIRKHGLQGASRERKTTTIPDPARPCPHDKADRKFKADAPDQRRVADFTYVNTAMGAAYAAFVIDVFARKIFGWRVPTSMTTRFVLYALSQAIRQRRSALVSLTRHPGRDMHCPSIRYTERLAEAGIDMSVGSIEESCDKFTQSIATRNTIWHFLPASLIS